MKDKKDDILNQIIDFLKSLLISLILVVILKMFVIDATKVSGNSMVDTLHDGDMLFVNKIEKFMDGYERGDIIIFDAPDDQDKIYIKRIIGLPNDTIELIDGKVFVNGNEYYEDYISVNQTLRSGDVTKWTLEDGQYFVMGDNRLPGASNDSRSFGPILEQSIIGHAFLRFYPFNNIGFADKE